MNPILAQINPILARELVKRMRGPKAMLMRLGYLGFLGLVFLLVYDAEVGDRDRFGGSSVVDWADIGQGMFEWTLMIMVLLVLFLVPGFTAGAITGERQRQTLMPLQISLMGPSDIVLGKLGASVVFTLLLVLGTMPLLTVAHMIGGITFMEIVKSLGMIMLTTVCVAAMSLLFSAIMKSSRTATVMSYVMVLALCFAVLAAMLLGWMLLMFFAPDLVILTLTELPGVIGWIGWSALALNPFAALAVVVGNECDPDWFGGSAGGPLSGFKCVFSLAEDEAPASWMLMPLWLLHIVLYGGLLALSVLGASRRVRVPADSQR